MSHTWSLGNFETSERDKYAAAIAASGFDLVIKDEKYDAKHNLRDEPGCSLWCTLLEGDLSSFWALIEAD